MSEEDARLVDRCRKGDREAFGLLVDRHQGALHSIALGYVGNPEDARDLAQKAFLKAWTSLAELTDASRFCAWVGRIVQNVALDALRSRALDDAFRRNESARPRIDPFVPPPEQLASRHELNGQVSSAVRALPEEYRSVVLLRFQEGMSYEEIARSLALPARTVKWRVHRAFELLRPALASLVEA